LTKIRRNMLNQLGVLLDRISLICTQLDTPIAIRKYRNTNFAKKANTNRRTYYRFSLISRLSIINYFVINDRGAFISKWVLNRLPS
jgi:hypothetical protein